MPDLTYTVLGLFTLFLPETPEGENAWKEIAKETDGTGKIFTRQLNSTLKQLRNAGYKVSKSKPVKTTRQDIFDLMDELGI